MFVEYAKAGPEDMLIRITVVNRGPEAAPIHLLPTLWFRNTWSWGGAAASRCWTARARGGQRIVAHHTDSLFQERWATTTCTATEIAPLLFTENETNHAAPLRGQPNATPYVKDGIHEFVVHGQPTRSIPARTGTKAAAHYRSPFAAGENREAVRLRLAERPGRQPRSVRAISTECFDERRREADAVLRRHHPAGSAGGRGPDAVMRQALAGMLWSKQYFYYDLSTWLEEHRVDPAAVRRLRQRVRNAEWFHMINDDIISMPDKWEYPWYAAWDLAFHMLALAMVDPDFAKRSST